MLTFYRNVIKYLFKEYGEFMKEMLKKFWVDFTTGTKTMFKEFFNKDTNKKQRANMWTFIRLITPLITLLLSIIAIITASPMIFISTALIAGFGALTDKFDGASARKHKSFSEYGKVLDQITDKSFAGIIGINLLFLNFNYIFVLLGELAIALTNISYKLKYKDLNINSTLTGKIKQTPLFLSLALGYLSTLNPSLLSVSNISILIAILFQASTVLSYINNNSEEVKKNKLKEIENYIKELDQQEEEKEKVLTKSIDSKNNISISKQCEDLKKLKEELLYKEDEIKSTQEKGFQKTLNKK